VHHGPQGKGPPTGFRRIKQVKEKAQWCDVSASHSRHRDPHSSRMLYGTNPVYNDESTWLIARTPELEHSLRTRYHQPAQNLDAV
jgi:hypothetical protein